MQRQHLPSGPRARSTSASPITPFRSQRALSRVQRSIYLCSKQLVFFLFILAIVVTTLLFAKTPDDHARAFYRSSRGARRSSQKENDLYGEYATGPSEAVRTAKPRLLSYNKKNFTLDGRPIRIVSGSVHYFRMVPSSWRRVLQYARGMGLNAIETYVPWNLHEQSPGKFRFSGILDLRVFLEIAYEEGLLVLLRPGPYICSEWDMGGLPPYLLGDNNMVLRSSNPAFMHATLRYFDEIAEQIAPYIGKAIHAIQIENEYGAYGHEKEYLHAILRAWEARGFSNNHVMYFTSDNGGTKSVLNGSQFESEKVLKTINLELNAQEKVEMLRNIQPDAPAMIAEFWVGWFDHWGEHHHVRDGFEVVRRVNEVLVGLDASINLYMFFGGTNFGFMAGANIDRDKYLADVTSYDYDGYVTEFGAQRAEKFAPMQIMLRQFWKSLGGKDFFAATYNKLPKPPMMSAYAGPVVLTEAIPLYDVLHLVADTSVTAKQPLSMEQAGGGFGFVMYRHELGEPGKRESKDRILRISGVRDFAYILLDGLVAKTIDRNSETERDGGSLKKIIIPPGTKQLDVIVENRGRVNYGKRLHDRKGILGNVTIDSESVEGFETITMSFPQDHPLLRDTDGREVLSKLKSAMAGRLEHPPLKDARSPPTFFRGEMSINPGSLSAFAGELPGTHCRVYGRGVLWVNGFNLGRFHTGVSGPQKTLFVPGALLQEGENEFIVLHMNMYLAREPAKIQLFDSPQLG